MFGLPEPVTASATPILDSTVLPPAGQRVHGTLITTFVCAVGALVLSQAGNDGSDPRLGAGSVLLSWAFVFTFAILVHELGHLVAGWAVGFRFNSFSVGLFLLHSEYGALKMRLVRGLPFLGMAAMHIKGVRRMRRRLLIMTIAGPGANLLSVPVTVLTCQQCFSECRSQLDVDSCRTVRFLVVTHRHDESHPYRWHERWCAHFDVADFVLPRTQVDEHCRA